MRNIQKAILVSVIISFGFFDLAMAETVTKPNTFTEGTPALATEVNENFDTLYDQVNKVGSEINIDSVNHFVGIGTTTPSATFDVNGGIQGISPLEISADAAVSRIYSTSYGDNAPHNGTFIGRRARGTKDSSSPVLVDDRLATFGGTGYSTSGWPTAAGTHRGSMRIEAAQNWTDTTQGTNIIFETTENDTITTAEKLRITDSGDVQVASGYLQLAQTSGTPPTTDCDETSEYGRMKIDAVSGVLYICVASGWIQK